jgi:hypothetical protein
MIARRLYTLPLMAVRLVSIYALSDPRDLRVRYVGQTLNPKVRMRQHVADSKRHDLIVHRWIRKLARDGVLPAMTILDQIDQVAANAAEGRWITHFGRLNGRMLNRAPAPEGVYLQVQRGEACHAAKMTGALVLEMRTLRADGATIPDLARRFNINVATVSHICRGETWAHVGGPLTADRRSNPRMVGTAHPAAKVSEADVLEMRTLYATGKYSQPDLATQYGLSQTTTGRLLAGLIWRHLGGPITKIGQGGGWIRKRPAQAKLSAEQVRELRADSAAGEAYASLARRFGISQPSASAVARGVHYRDIA